MDSDTTAVAITLPTLAEITADLQSIEDRVHFSDTE